MGLIVYGTIVSKGDWLRKPKLMRCTYLLLSKFKTIEMLLYMDKVGKIRQLCWKKRL